MIKHVRGNAISMFIDDEGDNAFAHGANCLCKMERETGIAHEVRTRLHELWEEDQATIPGDRSKLGSFSCRKWAIYDGRVNHIAYNLYTQFHNTDENDLLDYDALRSCFKKMREHMQSYGISKVYIPKIGTGLAKGDWSKILTIIEEETPDITVVVVEYDPGA